jgi:sugar-specific transcriptional regulator TrmB
MKISEILKKIGLSPNGAKLYLAALELGESNISRLAKKAGIKRTTAYLVAEELKERGLLNAFKKNKRAVYYAEDPRLLLGKLDEQKELLGGVLPELLSISNIIDRKPSIRFFEGDEGLREVFKDILQHPDQELLSMYADEYRTHFNEDFFHDYFIPQRKKLRIHTRALYPDTKAMQAFAKKNQTQLRQSKFLPAEFFKIEVGMNLYGSRYLNIVSFKEKIAIVIESQKIFSSMKGVFETLWHFAK